MHSKRAQISIFILLGVILVLGAISFMYFAYSYLDAAQNNEVIQRVQQLENPSQLNEYVESCLYDGALSGLWLLGKQGGGLYVEQGGSRDNDQAIAVRESDELVYILPGIADNNFYLSPLYPSGALRSSWDELSQSHITYFGKNNLAKLCDVRSMQDDRYACASVGGEESIQAQLAFYMKSQIAPCLQEAQDIFGVSPQFSENIEPRVVIADDAVHVYLDAPYTLTTQQGDQQVNQEVDTFYLELPVRLKQIHNALSKVIDIHTRDPTFVVEQSYRSLVGCSYGANAVCFDSDMSLGYRRNIIPGYHMITIEDKKSFLRNEFFTFRVMIPDRGPMLDYIGYSNSYGDVDLVAHVGDVIKFEPTGWDVDDISLTYTYEGWYQNYTSLFNYSCDCIITDSSLTLEDVATCFEMYTQQSCLEVYNIENDEQYLSLMQSPIYINGGMCQGKQQKGVCAETPVLTAEDKGLHTVRIRVADVFGKSDYQDVRVLVLD